MLETLPIEILLEIYSYLSPEEASVIAEINKKHAYCVSNPFWERKFEIHFPYLLNALPKDTNRNWYKTFKEAYNKEYALFSKTERAWFSLVKEGKLNESAGLSLEALFSLKDPQGISLISWARKKKYQHVLDYFWNKIVVPFFISSSNLKDKDGNSILHLAALLNQKEAAENLITFGETAVDIRTLFDNTPLHFAAKEGYLDIVVMLLEKGADINARTKAGATALLFAIENNHPDVVELLLKQGADTSIPLRESTPYHTDFKVYSGDAPLHAAINLGRKNIVKQLLIAKTDKSTLLKATETILNSSAEGSYAQERKKKTVSFFKPRDVRKDQLAVLKDLNENSPVELIVKTFITISKAIHQEYHFGGDSTLATLIDQALDEAVKDENKLLFFKY